MTPEERRRDAEALAAKVRRLLAQKRGTEIDPNATDIEEATDDQREETEILDHSDVIARLNQDARMRGVDPGRLALMSRNGRLRAPRTSPASTAPWIFGTGA